MPGVLKVQTAPGVWEAVVPPAPAAVPPQDVLHVGAAAPVDPVVELWWDDDEPAPAETFTEAQADLRFLNLAGGTLAGPLLINRALPTDPALRVGKPSDYWTAGDAIFVSNLGALHSSGGYRVSLSGNGYRNASSGWTSLASNGLAGSTQIDLDPAGYILFSASALVPVAGTALPPAQARIVGSGLVVGKTSSNTYTTAMGFETWSTSGQTFVTNSTGTQSLYIVHLATADATGNGYVRFYRGATTIGGITQNGTTGVLYNVTSDGTFKGDVADIDDDDALARIDALRPVTYRWKLDANGDPRTDGTPTGDVETGFIAQELVVAEPGAVTAGYGTQADHDTWREAMSAYTVAGEARDVDPTVQLPSEPGEDPFMPWQVDLSRLVPTLTAAVRALIHRNADLTARVAALEGV